MQGNIFQKQEPKLKLEAALKATLCGLAVGLGANFVAALVLWLTPLRGLWIVFAVLAVVTLIAAPIFYFAKFRPNDVSSARRIDRMGLDERLITMVEFSDEDSYMAKIQREDAKAALAAVESRDIRIRISRAIVTALSICLILGAGMTTVGALDEAGLLPGGDELIDSFIEEQTTVYVMVSYVVEDGGIIEGDEEQLIVKGAETTPVTAVADDGFVFKCWSDGYANPTRYDTKVEEDVIYVAIFMELDEGNGQGNGDGEGEGDGEGDGEGASDVPSEGEGQGQGKGESNQPSQDPGNGAGGQWKPNNGFIDGETNYRDVLGEYQDAAEEVIEDSESELTDEEKELIDKYLGIV